MRIVKKTKKYQSPEAVLTKREESSTHNKMLSAEDIAQTHTHMNADDELIAAMKEASLVKYDILTIAAMQHYIEQQK